MSDDQELRGMWASPTGRGGLQSAFSIGGISVAMSGESPEDVAFVPSLEPFRSSSSNPDIHIRVRRVPRLGPVPGQPLFDSGTTWSVYKQDSGLRFDFSAALFGARPIKRMLIDSAFRRAELEINQECAAALPHSLGPLGYPLDELLIMHRLTQEKAIELHGAGIVRADGAGNLFVGHSGAGKSTTMRLWTSREDVEVLSDDRIIVRRDEAAGQGKLRMFGTPWHGEAMYASPSSAPLARIFVLEHGYGNVLKRLPASQAVAELFARSFVPFHQHEYVDSALEFLQEVASSVPVYHYSFEPDPRAVETILNLHD